LTEIQSPIGLCKVLDDESMVLFIHYEFSRFWRIFQMEWNKFEALGSQKLFVVIPHFGNGFCPFITRHKEHYGKACYKDMRNQMSSG